MSDEVAALDFDFACTQRLIEYDDEKEKRLIEALTAGAMNNMLSQLVPPKK